MTNFPFLKSPAVLMEISHDRLRAFQDGRSIELVVERNADGRLTPGCREMLANGLKPFVRKQPLQSRTTALCAISAVGVSLRRLSLPAAANQEFEKMLRLQIEAEFPLSPDELAWGWREIETKEATRQIMVAAVKKEVVEDYAEVLRNAGLEPEFTLASLARNFLAPEPEGSHALLDVSGARPEWCVVENGVPILLRVLPATAEVPIADAAARMISGWSGRKIYLTGGKMELAVQLAQQSGKTVERLPVGAEDSGSAATGGLSKALERGAGAQLIRLRQQARPAKGLQGISRDELRPWLIRAVALVCLLLLLPYIEALVLKPLLARKLAALQADKGRLAMIDQELDFLQSLKQSQPPYLDALFVLSKSAPQGTRFDSMNMNRQGDLNFRGTMQNGQQVTDFRSKLIASGFFANVTVEEQTPSQDRQHVNVRMTAHWKPYEARAALAISPTPDEIQQAKTNKDAGAPGMFPAGMMMPP